MDIHLNAVYQVHSLNSHTGLELHDIYEAVISAYIENKPDNCVQMKDNVNYLTLGSDNIALGKLLTNNSTYIVSKKINTEANTVEGIVVKGNNKGKRVTIDASRLKEPDIFPRYMFNDAIWCSKADLTISQLHDEVDKRLSDIICDAALQRDLIIAAASDEETAAPVLKTVKKLLMPFFGGFLLALLMGYIKQKMTKFFDTNKKSNDHTFLTPKTGTPAIKGY